MKVMLFVALLGCIPACGDNDHAYVPSTWVEVPPLPPIPDDVQMVPAPTEQPSPDTDDDDDQDEDNQDEDVDAGCDNG